MHIICTDLEGVFTPEVWINVAEKTGIDKLRITTRDEPDYDKLMRYRIGILRDNNITLKDIQQVIASIEPLPGAKDFLDWLRSKCSVIVVSDTFVQFADPLMEKLGRPTLFCNSLLVDLNGFITEQVIRQQDGKRKVALALKELDYAVIGVGDSYNDIAMLKAADAGILYCPPDNVVKEFPQFPVAANYSELKTELKKHLER